MNIGGMTDEQVEFFQRFIKKVQNGMTRFHVDLVDPTGITLHDFAKAMNDVDKGMEAGDFEPMENFDEDFEQVEVKDFVNGYHST